MRNDWVYAEIQHFKGEAVLLDNVPIAGVKNRDPIGCNLGMVDLVDSRAKALLSQGVTCNGIPIRPRQERWNPGERTSLIYNKGPGREADKGSLTQDRKKKRTTEKGLDRTRRRTGRGLPKVSKIREVGTSSSCRFSAKSKKSAFPLLAGFRRLQRGENGFVKDVLQPSLGQSRAFHEFH